ncbi:MAG: UDP-3-O-(3-hydroxymyristoyl)glucosamine N-acyltransferase [Sedimenticolaceae bacterium]
MSGHTLGDIARAIGAHLEGVAERAVAGMATLAEAGPSELCYAASSRMVDQVICSTAAGIIVDEDFPTIPGRNLLRSRDPKTAFVLAMEMFAPDRRLPGIHPSAEIAKDAKIGADAAIGPCAVIESGVVVGARSQIRAGVYLGRDVRIGADCDIGPNAVLMDGTLIGDRCILHPGVVLGADGYGFQWMDDHHHKIPQLGRVVVQDDVEIGANACIDRATLGETRIGRGSKFDNLVQVGHNNRLGEHVLMVAQSGIAGSSRLGNGVVVAGQAGIADHVAVGEGAQIGGQSGVTGDLEPGVKVSGAPARPTARVLRERAALARLPELLRAFRRQEKELDELRDRIARLELRESK